MYVPDRWTGDALPELRSRQRHAVATTAVILADWAYDDADEIGDRRIHAMTARSLLSELPPCTWHQNLGWRRQMARTFDDLAGDAQSGADPLPRCTGEEMALHIVLIKAAGQHLDGEPDHLLGAIPPHPNDTDWISPMDFLFDDYDVLTLFDIAPDHIGGGLNLEPESWFIAFDHAAARDRWRGFRRRRPSPHRSGGGSVQIAV
ncbi:hypothetical protein [Rhodococcus jostii]|uniref:hypothetical protein n=1 Tax=Rhodococcus jostii TaxID=132919 RepID=UPI00365051AF